MGGQHRLPQGVLLPPAHLVLGQVAAPGVAHFALGGLLDAPEQGGVLRGRAVVVPQQHRLVVGVGPDHRHIQLSVQGEQAVVFQQHHALLGHLPAQGQVLRALHHIVGQVVVGAVLVEHAQPEPGLKQPLHAGGDGLLGDQVQGHGGLQPLVGVPAVEGAAVVHRQGGALRLVLRHVVLPVDVADGPAVRDHIPLKAEHPVEDVLEQGLAAAGGLPVDPVVGPHHRGGAGVVDAVPEGPQIRLEQVFLPHLGVEAVAQALRPAVDGVVLQGGVHLPVHRVVPLQSLDESRAHSAGEVGVLPVSLVAPAPPGVPEDVDVGGPGGDALVDLGLPEGPVLVVLGPHLVGDGGGGVLHPVHVEGGRQPDGLGEHRGRPGPGHPVEGLVPPVVGGHPQPGDGRGVVLHLGALLRQSHLGHQVVGPFPGRSLVASHSVASFPWGLLPLLPLSYSHLEQGARCFPGKVSLPAKRQRREALRVFPVPALPRLPGAGQLPPYLRFWGTEKASPGRLVPGVVAQRPWAARRASPRLMAQMMPLMEAMLMLWSSPTPKTTWSPWRSWM